MGCKGSKSKKNAYFRVAQYQKESWAAERALSITPEPFEWVSPPKGCITPSCLHNLLTDGFYAPFAANPHYLLLIDCRTEKAFTKRRLMTAYWHKKLMVAPPIENCLSIVLYDDRPRTVEPPSTESDTLARIFHSLKKRGLDPKVVAGGWPAIEIICRHLTVIGVETLPRNLTMPWYPTLVIPGFLYLGHAGTAADPRILTQLRVSHIVALSEVIPQRVLPCTNYLVVPLAEGDPVSESETKCATEKSNGPDLVSSMPTVLAFVSEARAFGGSVLVECDQGLTRAAVIVMALLMTERRCSLEDAFYYVRGARSSVHPHLQLLQQLAAYETSLYGAPLTAVDELF